MNLLLSYDQGVVKSLQLAKLEAGEENRLATSVDLLIGILSQTQLAVTQSLNLLGVTIENVRSLNYVPSQEHIAESHRRAECATAGLSAAKHASGPGWKGWWYITAKIRAALDKLAGKPRYSADALDTFRRAAIRALESQRSKLTSEDFVWALTNSIGAESVFHQLSIDPETIRNSV